jgi:hypothetical protein
VALTEHIDDGNQSDCSKWKPGPLYVWVAPQNGHVSSAGLQIITCSSLAWWAVSNSARHAEFLHVNQSVPIRLTAIS